MSTLASPSIASLPTSNTTSLNHCKDCGLNFDSETSLSVHLQYHKENLLSIWGRKDGYESSSSQESIVNSGSSQGFSISGISPTGKSPQMTSASPISSNPDPMRRPPELYPAPHHPSPYAYRLAPTYPPSDQTPPFYAPPHDFYPPPYPKYPHPSLATDANGAAILDLDTQRLHVYQDPRDENVPPFPPRHPLGGSPSQGSTRSPAAWYQQPAQGPPPGSVPWGAYHGGPPGPSSESPKVKLEWSSVGSSKGPPEWPKGNESEWIEKTNNAEGGLYSQPSPTSTKVTPVKGIPDPNKKRPFSCDICNKQFIRKGHLNRHLTTTAHRNKATAKNVGLGGNPSTTGRTSSASSESSRPQWTPSSTGDRSEVRSAFESFYNPSPSVPQPGVNNNVYHNLPPPSQQLLPSISSAMPPSFRPPSPPKTLLTTVASPYPPSSPSAFMHTTAHQRNGFYNYSFGPPPAVSTASAFQPPTSPFGTPQPSSPAEDSPSPTASDGGNSLDNLGSGGKPYRCGVCPKTFNHKTDLRRHICLHTGEKPYVCGICGKRFIRKDHMTKHEEIHRKPSSSLPPLGTDYQQSPVIPTM